MLQYITDSGEKIAQLLKAPRAQIHDLKLIPEIVRMREENVVQIMYSDYELQMYAIGHMNTYPAT